MKPLERAAIKAEYKLILKALEKTNFNKSKAAEILQIDRKTLYNKIDAYGACVTVWGNYDDLESFIKTENISDELNKEGSF